MTLRVLFDTNVVLDVLLARSPWLEDAAALWRAIDESRLVACLPASTLTDIYYVARKLTDRERARKAVVVCLETFEIAPVDRLVLAAAQALEGADYEDDVQIACGQAVRVEAIVTRDLSGFVGSPLPVYTPSQLRAMLNA
ncbi:MAG: PIN domain-containing protein [Vulcanimicrobiota bacterium]